MYAGLPLERAGQCGFWKTGCYIGRASLTKVGSGGGTRRGRVCGPEELGSSSSSRRQAERDRAEQFTAA